MSIIRRVSPVFTGVRSLFFLTVLTALLATGPFPLVPAETAASTGPPQLINDDASVKPEKFVEPAGDDATTETNARVQGIITDEFGHGLWATVTLDDDKFTTPDGRFAVDVNAQSASYEITTLFGTYSGRVALDDDDDVTIALPVHAGYGSAMEPHLKEAVTIMLLQNSAGQPHNPQRWKRGRNLNVWIEPYDDGTEQLGMQAFNEWQTVLRDTITFTQTDDKDQADLTIRYVSFHVLGGPGGYTNGHCRRRISQGYMSRGEILIVNHLSDDITVHLHEIGHCLGLGHNPFGGQLMSPVAAGKQITKEEAGIIRALYSWPAGPHWPDR